MTKAKGIRRVKDKKTGKPAKDKKGLPIWDVNVSCGFDPATGTYQRVWKKFHGTKTEAERFRRDLEVRKDGGENIVTSKATFADYSRGWLEARVASGEFRDNTIKSDRTNLRILNAYIGRVKLCSLSPAMVDAAYTRIRKERGLSGTTMNHIHKTLNEVLKQAVMHDVLLRNPCDKVKAPKRDESPRRSLTAEEAARLLLCIRAEEQRAIARAREVEAHLSAWGKDGTGRGSLNALSNVACAYATHLIMATGARRGEALALVWGDIDLDAQTVSIGKSLGKGCKVSPPKTKAGIRNVAIDAGTADALAAWREFAASELGVIGVGVTDDTPVFCNGIGAYIDPCNYSRWWREFREASGFHGLKTHELRHTQATLLIGNNADIKTVQHRLGHRKASTTLDMYAHALPENDRKAADLVATLFEGGKAKEEGRLRVVRAKTA